MEKRYSDHNDVIRDAAREIIGVLGHCDGAAKINNPGTMEYLKEVAEFPLDKDATEKLGDLRFTITSPSELVFANVSYNTVHPYEDPNLNEALDSEGNKLTSRTISLQPFEVRVNACTPREGLAAMNDEFTKFIGVLESIAAVVGDPVIVTSISQTAGELREDAAKWAVDNLRMIASGCVELIARSKRGSAMVFESREGDEARAKIPEGTCATFESTVTVNRRRAAATFDAVMVKNGVIVVTRRDK